MGLLSQLSRVRYTRAAEVYSRRGSQVAANHARAGAAAIPAVVARAGAQADAMDGTSAEGASEGQGQAQQQSGGVLRTIAGGIATAIGWEQSITGPLGAIPFFNMPALRVLDMDVGLPHAHAHPPNIIPPNPVPIPLPSTGPVIKIPILSGAGRTLINGSAAARCGDFGLGVWCGGYFPMYEVFLGSANTWIEMARAGRLAVDITKHCIFTVPKPTDPPLGPMVGTTVAVGSGNVLIGGVPLPSLFSLAIARIFKYAFKGAGAAFRRLTARRYVAKLTGPGGPLAVRGSGSFADDVADDLVKIARTRSGRQMLRSLEKSGRTTTIMERGMPAKNLYNASAGWTHADDAMRHADFGGRAKGSDAVVSYDPRVWSNHAPPGTPHPHPGTTSDSILFHEMTHAQHTAHGAVPARVNDKGQMSHWGASETTDNWNNRWANFEEYSTTHADNGYRMETGTPLRSNYGNLP